VADILITSKRQLLDFLKARNIDDGEIKWTCPVCGTVNLGAYYSHSSPCGGCDKFVFPRLNLKELLKDEQEANEIAKEIASYGKRIDRQREVISDLESDLTDERRRLEDLRDELRSLKSCDMKKVREDW